MNKVLLTFLALLFASQLSAQPATDPFQGSFLNRQNAIGLRLKRETMGYTGVIIHATGSFPLTGLRIGTILMGEYDFNGNKIAFSLIKKNKSYAFTSEGIELSMDFVSSSSIDSILKLNSTAVSNASKTSPQPAVKTGESKFWQERLSNKRLLFLQSDNYGSKRITIDLLPDGQFLYMKTLGMLSTGGVGTGTYADQEEQRGSWEINQMQGQTVLVLRTKNGEVTYYPISKGISDGQVLLNNSRYFIQTK